VRARPVDPRDETSEVDDPAYRVYFWAGSACDEWELTEADLDEVLTWIDQTSNGRTHSLWVVRHEDRGVELIASAGSTRRTQRIPGRLGQ
jgi:hypothetical protein